MRECFFPQSRRILAPKFGWAKRSLLWLRIVVRMRGVHRIKEEIQLSRNARQKARLLRHWAQDKSLLALLLPHKCGVPPGYGTPHLCGSEEFCRAPESERGHMTKGITLFFFATLAFFAVCKQPEVRGPTKYPCVQSIANLAWEHDCDVRVALFACGRTPPIG